jgi:Arc/MetJ-type ribon-helix-helix transcriptional regulator
MANTERFAIELPAELAAYVHAKVDRDALASESDVVRAMQQRDAELDALRGMVGASIAAGGSLTDEQAGDCLDERAGDCLDERAGRWRASPN